MLLQVPLLSAHMFFMTGDWISSHAVIVSVRISCRSASVIFASGFTVVRRSRASVSGSHGRRGSQLHGIRRRSLPRQGVGTSAGDLHRKPTPKEKERCAGIDPRGFDHTATGCSASAPFASASSKRYWESAVTNGWLRPR